LEDNFIGVVAIVGEEGTCKTTMGLTFELPLFHFEIDVGGFRRAAWRLEKTNPELRVKRCGVGEDLTTIDFSAYDIITKPYPKPLQQNKLMGQLTGQGSSPSIRTITQPKKVEGMREMWQTFITDFVYVCGQRTVTLNFDSSTVLWNIAHNCRLQELQENQEYKWKLDSATKSVPFPENEYRERLQPIEYGPANDRMRTLLDTARSFGKNLILVHYPTDEYGTVADGKGGVKDGKTGRRVIDGFKETAKLCDLIVWTSVKDMPNTQGKTIKMPIAKITKCGVEGMGLDAVGQEIPASMEGFINLRNLMMSI